MASKSVLALARLPDPVISASNACSQPSRNASQHGNIRHLLGLSSPVTPLELVSQ
jgi:hypothetical protein